MSQAPSVWVKEARPEVLAQGQVREEQEEKANKSYDELVAPACPACGKPVKDEEWADHKALHGSPRSVIRPYGKVDSREALFTAPDQDRLEQKICQWRESHPGIILEPMGEGKDRQTGLVFVRFRLKPGLRKRIIL